jgi:hypothetical protein
MFHCQLLNHVFMERASSSPRNFFTVDENLSFPFIRLGSWFRAMELSQFLYWKLVCRQAEFADECGALEDLLHEDVVLNNTFVLFHQTQLDGFSTNCFPTTYRLRMMLLIQDILSLSLRFKTN